MPGGLWQIEFLGNSLGDWGIALGIFLATFAVLWWVYHAGHSPATFQTGWFIEGLLTQLLVVLVLRTRSVRWRAGLPSGVVVIAAAAAAAIGLLVPVTPLAAALRMTPPPVTYLVWLLGILAAYGLAAQLVKKRYLRHHRAWL